MPEPPTVANSSCLIAMEASRLLHLLEQLYGTIHVPEGVARESGPGLPSWITVQPVKDRVLVQSLVLELGAGEAEAIALSIELSAVRLILDDKKARRIARQLHQPVTGTLAILLRAKERGLISRVRDAVAALIAVQIRVADALVEEVLRQAGE